MLAHPAAERERGAGIAMCCTFGDLTDVQWWRELKLPARTIIGRDGRILADPPAGLDAPEGRKAYAELAGATVHTARERVVAMLRESGDLDGEPRRTVRPVKFYEKGDKPLEIVSSRQWFIRSMAHQDVLLRRGEELNWDPSYMKARYDDWVRGLNGDWLISRQRFFGVPFPVWYPLDEHGEPDYESVILPSEDTLPVDPSSDTAPGYAADQRGRPGGFIGETDVMDTWATSSLTPQIACGWEEDPELYAKTFPMDLRPQGHDIIRTWLVATILRARAMLSTVDDVVRQATEALSSFEYTTALERVERFFWFFCDDYLELVKQRAYEVDESSGTQSARLALRTALSVLQRLLAPFLPYAAEEAWSWWHDTSVHAEAWPVPVGVEAAGSAETISVAATAISAIRKAKSDAKRSMRAPVESVSVHGPESALAIIQSISVDLCAAGSVGTLRLTPAEGDLRFDVTLADE